MTYQIDQSGKIEQTNKDTILCLSNGSWDTLLIRSKTKRQLQEIFRRHGQNRNYVIFVFCAALSLLLKRHRDIGSVIIDKEYFGKDSLIKKIVLEMLKVSNVKPEIGFSSIGRNVNAHSLAYKTYIGKIKPKTIFETEKILEEIKKTEVGKRLKNA